VTRLVQALLAFVVLLLCVDTASAQVEPRPARKGRRYTIKIDSSPQQAAIYLDDKKYGIVGYTPYSGKLVMGDYKLILELPGFKAIERPIHVDRKNRTFFLPLEKQEMPGTVDIQATADPNVAGARVTIDGQAVGTAPTLYDAKEGRHQVQITKEGFDEYNQWVDLKQGQRVTITPVLKAIKKEPPKGSLLVDADVPDAEVFIDGKKQDDSTPTLVDGLEDGPHIVEVRKSPATPWKQTVYVKGGQRTKVTAELAATLRQKKGGTVRVLANVPGAEVWVDGRLAGTAPHDAADLAAGEHIIEVRAKGYTNKEQRVTVNAGSADILKFDLVAAAANVATTGKIKVVSPVPEARVFIDGANVGTAPADKELTAGEHFVVVEKEGFAKFEQKVAIEAGQTITVTAQLRSVGKVRFLSTPAGAEVVLDGKPVGKTPYEADIEGGEHVVTVRLEGYFDFEQPLKVEGGQTVNVSAPLRLIDSGPTAEEIVRRKATLSSYSARTMPFGDFTVDLSIGYPYWVEGQATVGGTQAGTVGWDLTLGFRSLLTTWEFLGTLRLRLFERDPFAFAAFGTVGGGGGFNGRNQFTLQTGVLNTVTFKSGLNAVTVTGRAFFDIWSDRLCGVEKNGSVVEDAPGICTAGPGTPERTQILEDFGINDPTDRDNGVRFYISLVVEAALNEKLNVFFIFEGAPFQGQRAAHSETFNGTMLGDDPIYNGRLGFTFKF
jgi:PEGA domain